MKETETKTQNQTQDEELSKGKRVFKAIINTVINVMIVMVLVVSILIAVFALTSKATGISTLFGHTIQPIQSESMRGGSPDGYGGQEFGQGDLMIAKSTDFDPSAEYEKGDIVTFVTLDDEGKKMLIAHRIVNVITIEDGTKRYQTQGDNRETSPVPDQEEEKYFISAMDIGSIFYSSNYEGKILKGWGGFLDYIQTQQGFFFIVLLPMIIFFMYAVIRVVMSAMNYRKTKAEEEKDEAVKAAVAAALASKEAEPAGAISDNIDVQPTVPEPAEEENKPKED